MALGGRRCLEASLSALNEPVQWASGLKRLLTLSGWSEVLDDTEGAADMEEWDGGDSEPTPELPLEVSRPTTALDSPRTLWSFPPLR